MSLAGPRGKRPPEARFFCPKLFILPNYMLNKKPVTKAPKSPLPGGTPRRRASGTNARRSHGQSHWVRTGRRGAQSQRPPAFLEGRFPALTQGAVQPWGLPPPPGRPRTRPESLRATAPSHVQARGGRAGRAASGRSSSAAVPSFLPPSPSSPQFHVAGTLWTGRAPGGEGGRVPLSPGPTSAPRAPPRG